MSDPKPPRRRRAAAPEATAVTPPLGAEPASTPRRPPRRRKEGEAAAAPVLGPSPDASQLPATGEAPRAAAARPTRRRRVASAAEPALTEAVEPDLPPTVGPELAAAAPSLKPQPGLFWQLGLASVAAITRREIAAYFVSPIGYVVTAVLIVLVSLLGYLSQIVLATPVAMDSIFSLFALLMVFFTPLYTMRLFAEERRSGTLELLLSHPVRDWEVVVGKWLAALVFYLATAAFTLLYPVLIAIYDPIPNRYEVAGHVINIPGLDPGTLLTGYLGLILVGAAWVAIGALASSLTSNQIVAAILGIGMLMFLEYLAMAISLSTQGQLSEFFNYLSSANRSQSFGQGRLVLQDAVYFVSLTVGALFLTTRVLDSRRWR